MTRMEASTVADHAVPGAGRARRVWMRMPDQMTQTSQPCLCRDYSPSPVHSLVSSGLTDMLSTMLEAHTKLAAGNAADEQGYLLQVYTPLWTLFNPHRKPLL